MPLTKFFGVSFSVAMLSHHFQELTLRVGLWPHNAQEGQSTFPHPPSRLVNVPYTSVVLIQTLDAIAVNLSSICVLRREK
jgi:hypothetical protein